LRIVELERLLEEKDRELREVSINRAEFVQHLNTIYNLLKSTQKNKQSSKIVESIFTIDEKLKHIPETEYDKDKKSKKVSKRVSKSDLKAPDKFESDKKEHRLASH